ncbi:MAG TPA: site-specific integrase [Thermoanaerobaculia bacterium]|nr:site-specific integrase [Thermoanaerobaculia bacterium]
MPQILLTDRNVMSLTPKVGESRAEFWDLALPSFGLRVTRPTAKTKRGTRSFFVMYRTPTGRRRRLTIGTYPTFSLAQAREQAREKLRFISESVDPQELPAEDAGTTFGELAAEYLERHAKRKKATWRDDERRLRVELLPQWGRRPAREISRRDVILILDRVADRGAPISANRLRALISTVFNFGIGRDLVEHNPALKVPRPGIEKAGDRALSDDEIRKLWLMLNRSDNHLMAGILKVRILTGQRTREVARMRWEDLGGDLWRLPGSFTKNGRAHDVPLGPLALELLEELRPLTGTESWVFASPRKRGEPIAQIRRFVREAAQESGVAFVTRDLRRTVATGLARIGISQLTVAKLLNHSIPGVTDRHYDRHTYEAEKRRAVLAWDAHLRTLVKEEKVASNLVAFAPASP